MKMVPFQGNSSGTSKSKIVVVLYFSLIGFRLLMGFGFGFKIITKKNVSNFLTEKSSASRQH